MSKQNKLMMGALLTVTAMLLSGCIPRIEVATPKDPIIINMNVKIEHEINIKADPSVDKLLQQQPGLHNETAK